MNSFFFIAVTLIVLSYSGIFWLYAGHYWLEDYVYGIYSMSPMVFVVFLWLVWRKREVFNNFEGSYFNAGWGYILLFAAVLMKLHGEINGYSVLRGFSLIPLLFGLTIIFYPAETVKRMSFPYFYLIFVIPMPTFLLDELIRPLLDLNTFLVEKILAPIGLPIEKTGYVFSFNDFRNTGFHEVIIGGGCSGIGSLMVCLAIGALYLYLREINNRLKSILFAAIVFFTLAANTIRIIAMILMIYFFGPAYGHGFYHEYSGFFVFGTALVLSMKFEEFMNRNGKYNIDGQKQNSNS
ncbi:MAG: exosortase/archaeosortase family protein [Candidatus Riflebacteria bacterium]|nr:exosortase/archaeosortase family protein [Candidatus Riflebacteria bacterium]